MKSGRYRHYKGNEYVVIGIARHSETVDDCNHEQKGADKVLTRWRAKLEQEPTRLQPFQIDEIVREVRLRLSPDSR